VTGVDVAAVSALIRSWRSLRDFLPRPIPQDVLDAVLEDASWASSWSNTQPYRTAVASGTLRDQLAAELCGLFGPLGPARCAQPSTSRRPTG
jgi:nitroreductase